MDDIDAGGGAGFGMELDTYRRVSGCCAWLGGEIPFEFETLISYFFQSINVFWIPFELWCY